LNDDELDEEKVEAGKREFFDKLAPAAKKAAKVISVMSKAKKAVDRETTEKKDSNAEKAGKKVAKDIEHDEGNKAKGDNKAEKAGKKVTKDIEYDDKKDRKEKKTDEGNDGNLANNAKPYDKVTKGDVVAGRLGKDEMGGKKKKEEKVDETTVAGSVATSSGGKSSGGMSYGKGVYEGFNKSIERMISESIDVTETVTENEGESITVTVTADGTEADMLMQLLKSAGLSGKSLGSGCGCGNTPCSCDGTVDEAYGDTDETLNKPNWPTDSEKSNNALQYSGGLNGPKSTGQATTPVIASQLRRQISIDETVELERSLFNTWKNYKG
jgi:hypothetical protein